MSEKVKFDKDTTEWFKKRLGAETTVVQCPDCELYYKPELGHKCKLRKSTTVDCVEMAAVIRCKNCKHCSKFGGRIEREKLFCNKLMISVEESFYCKKGEV